MKRLAGVLVFCLLWSGLATAQTAVVKRNVNLRSEASTNSDVLEKLRPGAQLQLAGSDKTNGFYYVTAPDGQEGWLWARNLEIATSGGTPTATPAPAPSSPSTSGDLFSQLMNARTTPDPQPLIENGNQVCGPTGDAQDATAIALNTKKNRIDVPCDGSYVDINWNDLRSLPPDRTADFVGAPVRVIGFLSHRINVENTGRGESTNCHLLGDTEVDWHVYLTNSPAEPISQAIIVETTPRTRPQHRWTTDMLSPLVDSQTSVRISGWLMYDSEHVNAIGTQRATVWEVHPITKIEIQNNGQWVDLEAQP